MPFDCRYWSSQYLISTGRCSYKTALGVRLSSSNAMQNNSISIKQFINEKTAIEGLFTFGDPLSY